MVSDWSEAQDPSFKSSQLPPSVKERNVIVKCYEVSDKVIMEAYHKVPQQKEFEDRV